MRLFVLLSFSVFAALLLNNTVVKGQTARTNFFSRADSLNKSRLNGFIAGTTAAYGTSLVLLNQLWYKDFERGGFRFFNDNAEWKQIDKVGHFYSAFHISKASGEIFKWTGLEDKKSHFWGSMMGVIIMTPIEIFDGFSKAYGASYGDLIANTSGSALYLGQILLWKEIKIHPKFSFSSTSFAEIRPEILGKGLSEEILKDYNGQTYWLSFDINKFLKQGNRFPKWLNLAVGYGAEGMVYANDQTNLANGYRNYRQYFLAIDLDLTHFKHKSKFINTLLYIVNLVHLPAPALEFNKANGVKFHGFYF